MRGNRLLTLELVLCCVTIIALIWIFRPQYRKKIMTVGGASALRAGLAGLLGGTPIEGAIARAIIWSLVSTSTVIF